MPTAGRPGRHRDTACCRCVCATRPALSRASPSERADGLSIHPLVSYCVTCTASHVLRSHMFALQIRRSTYHDVVKVSDLTSLHVDLSGVQAYSINNARVSVTYRRLGCDNSRCREQPCLLCAMLCCLLSVSSSPPFHVRHAGRVPTSSPQQQAPQRQHHAFTLCAGWTSAHGRGLPILLS